METSKTWTELKALVAVKSLRLQYEYMTDSPGNRYLVWTTEGTDTYISSFTAASADGIDFIANYKDDANLPIKTGEDQIITDLALRDTDDHTSGVSDNRGAIPKTVVIYNETDEDLTVQLQGDRDVDFDYGMNMGSPFVVSSNTHDYATISDYLPYLRVSVSAITAPTTGTVDAYIMRVKS